MSARRDVHDNRGVMKKPSQEVKGRQRRRQPLKDIERSLDRRLRKQRHEDRVCEDGVVCDQGREVVRGDDRRRGELGYQRAENLDASDAVSSSEPGTERNIEKGVHVVLKASTRGRARLAATPCPAIDSPSRDRRLFRGP